MIDKRLHLATKAVSAINRSQYGDSVEKARAPWYKKVRASAREMAAGDVRAIRAAKGDVGEVARMVIEDRKGDWKSFISNTYKAVGSDFAGSFYRKLKKGNILYSKADSEFGVDAEWFAEEGVTEEDAEEWMLWGDEYVEDVSDDKAELIMGNRLAQVERGLDRMEDDADDSDLWEWLLIAAGVGADYFAITEVSAASNFGRRLAAERVAFDGGMEFEHEWVTVGDDRVRESHMDMDGVTLPFDEPFKVPGKFGTDELMFPGDASMGAGPDNVVNCRCTEFLKPS